VDADATVHLTQILQLSITPVALVSGVALLLLSMTNRLGRVIDRSRTLVERGGRGADLDEAAAAEVGILFRRARFLQIGIGLMATNVFFAVLMVAALFAMSLLGAALGALVLGLFGGCLLCLAASVACFLADIFLSIRWLRLSLGRYVR
jgi:hypothetical protein